MKNTSPVPAPSGSCFYRTMQFLDWFIMEQGEEETTADANIRKMELFGADGKGLYMLDAELAGRTYTTPSPLAQA